MGSESGYAGERWAGMLDVMRQRDEPDIRAGDLVTIQLDGEPERRVIVSHVEQGPGGELVLETIPDPSELSGEEGC